MSKQSTLFEFGFVEKKRTNGLSVNSSSSKPHFTTVEGIYKCSECTESFHSNGAVASHKAWKHPKHKPLSTTDPCQMLLSPIDAPDTGKWRTFSFHWMFKPMQLLSRSAHNNVSDLHQIRFASRGISKVTGGFAIFETKSIPAFRDFSATKPPLQAEHTYLTFKGSAPLKFASRVVTF